MSDIDPSISRTFALTIAYDGTRYAGWQNQANAVSIQQRMEEAAEAAFGHRSPIVASGRTDSGVHAHGQIARLVMPRWNHASDKLVPALNRRLPFDIVVRHAREARPDFDPVRNAIAKRYRYTIRNAACPDPIMGRFHWFHPRPLDVEIMRVAAQRLIGCHDFIAFQTLGSPRKTTVRTVREMTIDKRPAIDGYDIGIEVEADGFLYNMVRNIVGALVVVGAGDYGPGWIESMLMSKERSRGVQTAPPRGLCLMRVDYPDACFVDK